MIEKVINFGVFLLRTQTDTETLSYAALITALELGVFLFFVKYKPLFRIRNWWTIYKLQPSGKFDYKHYVRVIEKTPKLTEGIYEIKNRELHIPFSQGEVVYTAKTGNKSGKYYVMLEEKNSKEAIHLNLNSAYDLNVRGEQILLIYTNIRVYVSKANWQRIVCLIGAILLVPGYICYLKFFADPNHLYSFGFVSMMFGIIFSYLIYLFEKNR